MRSDGLTFGSLALVIFVGCLALTGCGSSERIKAVILCRKCNVEVELPKPYTESKTKRDLGNGLNHLVEMGYIAEDYEMQIKVLELGVGHMQTLGLTRHGLFKLAQDREVGPLKIIQQEDVNEPEWPERISNATDYAFDSADGKTRTYIRELIYSGPDFTRCSIVLKAVAPKSETRPTAVDDFFNSLRITDFEEIRPSQEFKYTIQ